MSVPGPADSALSQGPHELLRQGAALAGSLDDILAELPMLRGLCASPGVAEGEPEGINFDGKEVLKSYWIIHLVWESTVSRVLMVDTLYLGR